MPFRRLEPDRAQRQNQLFLHPQEYAMKRHPKPSLNGSSESRMYFLGPLAVLALLAAIVVLGRQLRLERQKAPPRPPVQVEELPPVQLQQWMTADAGAFVSRLVVGKLKPHPGQKTGDCDPDLGEQERDGACWMKTDVPPPCPKGKLQEDDGKCWRPIPKTARKPTSGEPRSGGVADP